MSDTLVRYTRMLCGGWGPGVREFYAGFSEGYMSDTYPHALGRGGID